MRGKRGVSGEGLGLGLEVGREVALGFVSLFHE